MSFEKFTPDQRSMLMIALPRRKAISEQVKVEFIDFVEELTYRCLNPAFGVSDITAKQVRDILEEASLRARALRLSIDGLPKGNRFFMQQWLALALQSGEYKLPISDTRGQDGFSENFLDVMSLSLRLIEDVFEKQAGEIRPKTGPSKVYEFAIMKPVIKKFEDAFGSVSSSPNGAFYRFAQQLGEVIKMEFGQDLLKKALRGYL